MTTQNLIEAQPLVEDASPLCKKPVERIEIKQGINSAAYMT